MRIDDVPEGYRREWVAEPETHWRVGADGRRCSMYLCHNEAVAQLARQRNRRGLVLVAWYSYCPSHLYGRKIEDGVVKFQRLVKIGEEGAA